MSLTDLTQLGNGALVETIEQLAASERHATAALIAHLAEMDRRELHLALGFRSLFEYCCEALHLSEHAAYDRIEVARLSRRLPRVLDLLGDGSIHLTAARLLSPHLTLANHERVLAEARHKRKWQVEEIVARLAPRSDLAARVRAVSTRGPAGRVSIECATGRSAGAAATVDVPLGRASEPPATGPLPECALGSTTDAASHPAGHGGCAAAEPAGSRRARDRGHVAPLSPERYEFRFTAARVTRDRLRQAQDLLRHAVPDGDMGEIVDRALQLLIAETLRRKCASVAKTRRGPGVPRLSRTIPADVRRAVWRRDGGRCRFVARDGRRCSATALLEFHHVTPWAAGGPTTYENIEMRCRAHNRMEADLYFAPIRESRANFDRRPGSAARPRAGGERATARVEPR